MPVPDLNSIASLLGIAGVAIGVLVWIRYWIRPIRILTSVRLNFEGVSPGEIAATITNMSKEDQVVVSCVAKSAHSVSTAIVRHLRHPFTPPRLYQTIWYAGVAFEMMGKEPLRLQPKARVELSHTLSTHPLSKFMTPYVQVEVELSNGRKFRGARMEVPDKWMFMRVLLLEK